MEKNAPWQSHGNKWSSLPPQITSAHSLSSLHLYHPTYHESQIKQHDKMGTTILPLPTAPHYHSDQTTRENFHSHCKVLWRYTAWTPIGGTSRKQHKILQECKVCKRLKALKVVLHTIVLGVGGSIYTSHTLNHL